LALDSECEKAVTMAIAASGLSRAVVSSASETFIG